MTGNSLNAAPALAREDPQDNPKYKHFQCVERNHLYHRESHRQLLDFVKLLFLFLILKVTQLLGWGLWSSAIWHTVWLGVASYIVLKQNDLTAKSVILQAPKSRFGLAVFLFYVALTLVVGFLGDAGLPHYGRVPLLQGLVCFGLLAPISEELFFRGVCLKEGLKKQSPSFAIYTNALIFMLFHLPLSLDSWEHFWEGSLPLSPGTFVLGLGVAFVTWKDGSIRYAVALHMAANILGYRWLSIVESLGVKDIFFL